MTTKRCRAVELSPMVNALVADGLARARQLTQIQWATNVY